MHHTMVEQLPDCPALVVHTSDCMACLISYYLRGKENDARGNGK